MQEMDSIVTQMIQVAHYLGWDVTELRPVRTLIQIGAMQKANLILLHPFINKLSGIRTDNF